MTGKEGKGRFVGFSRKGKKEKFFLFYHLLRDFRFKTGRRGQ